MIGHSNATTPLFLVTTALEETWPTDGSAAFAGQWCLKPSRQPKWSSLSYEVLPYHWDDRARIPMDLQVITGMYEDLLPHLGHRLNTVHGVSYSTRYWRITVGWWLYYFAQVYFDRWAVLQEASATNRSVRMRRLTPAASDVAPQTTEDFIQAATTDEWNERLFADIAQNWFDFEVELVAQPPNQPELPDGPAPTPSVRRTLSGLVKAALYRLGPSRHSRIFIHGLSLSSSRNVGLQLLLGQRPAVTRSSRPVHVGVDPSMRAWTLAVPEGSSHFLRSLAAAVPVHLPTVFLEGYAVNSELAESLGWPRDPKVIVTANSIAGDELWKMYTASRCETGTRLVVSQHGGHYGTGLWSAIEDHELAISDEYFTWGWSKPEVATARPAPSARLVGLPKRTSRNSGECLLITAIHPRYSYWLYSAPVGPQWISYLDDQFAFARRLSAEVQARLRVRLYPQDYGWEQALRWQTEVPNTRLDTGQEALEGAIARSRLCVSTYNATTFLETMTMNVPTIMYWNPLLWELNAHAKPVFDGLRRAGVLFDDPEACAAHVNDIWSDVPAWWQTDVVQDATSLFLTSYARVGARPLRHLRDELKVTLGGGAERRAPVRTDMGRFRSDPRSRH